MTFWRARWHKCTNFAIESISQPFGTQVAFGYQAQVTLNRNGDLIYWMYVCVDLPGLATSVDENQTVSQYPSLPKGSACRACRDADAAAMDAYIGDGFTDAGDEEQEAMLAEARGKWQQDVYKQANTAVTACEPGSDNPSDMPCGPSHWAHWTNNIGHYIIDKATLVIGGSPIDTLYGDLLNMYEELQGKSGRKLTEMTGKRYSRMQLVCSSREPQSLWIPLPFWFCANSGTALPLCSLQFHGVQLQVSFSALKNCIVTSAPNVVVKNSETMDVLKPMDLSACVESCYVYLDTQERESFASNAFEALIIQNQVFTTRSTSSQVTIPLQFNHPVTELIFAVRRQCQAKANNHFNYSGVGGREPIKHVSLLLNNQPRFSQKHAQYFRLVQPWQHHSQIPESHVYNFSFALHPEDTTSPSGSCNFSRIDNVTLKLALQEELGKEDIEVIVYARNWNLIRYRNGLAGLAYAN